MLEVDRSFHIRTNRELEVRPGFIAIHQLSRISGDKRQATFAFNEA